MLNITGQDVPAWVLLHALKHDMVKADIIAGYGLSSESFKALIDRGIEALKRADVR